MSQRRASDLAGAAIGFAALVTAGAIARRGVGEVETAAFHRVNRLPDAFFRTIWVPMQYGTFGTVPALGAVALAKRRPRLAVAVATGGTAAWLLAKAIKPAVGRGRPADAVAGARLRGKEEGDLGFPSGHAAVSAALTILLRPYSSNGWRRASTVLAIFVPFSRLYVGAHLPLDAVGGSALGLADGCGVNLALGSP